jgi:BioD-like phosphotransacetylase family protein
MVNNLYVTSAETFSGKSAICIGLGLHFRNDGLKVGYLKPVNINCPLCDGLGFDEDVVFAKQAFEMPESPQVIGPVALSAARLEQQLRGPETDYEPKLKESLGKLSAGRDLLVLEGGRSLREGYIVGLPPRRVVELADAKVLLVVRYDESLMVDRARTAQDYFGSSLIGVVINEVPNTAMDNVHGLISDYLGRHHIDVLGILPKDPVLLAPTVAELIEGLNAEVLCCAESRDELVEDMLVGAMSVEGALTYFRRKPHKAVITGGDRTDLQMAALETSTRCLILTGNLYPSPVVMNRAAELHVPVLLVNMDTLSTTEVISGYFGRSRFQQPEKIARFAGMLDERFNFGALYKSLGVSKA